MYTVNNTNKRDADLATEVRYYSNYVTPKSYSLELFDTYEYMYDIELCDSSIDSLESASHPSTKRDIRDKFPQNPYWRDV